MRIIKLSSIGVIYPYGVPLFEAVSLLPSLKVYLGIAIDDTTRDAVLIGMIQAAGTLLESYTNNPLFRDIYIAVSNATGYSSTLGVKLPDVNHWLELLPGAVDLGINLPSDNISALGNYNAMDKVFVSNVEQLGSFFVLFATGFLTLPEQLKLAIFVLIAQWDINQKIMAEGIRPMTIPYSVQQLCNGYRDFREFV
jgi:hypothetical protein